MRGIGLALVALLVADHDARSTALLDGRRRSLLAERVRVQRAERDAARYELLDAAVRRLVDRHGPLTALFRPPRKAWMARLMEGSRERAGLASFTMWWGPW